ncbi:MAG: DegV family protein [Lachnospiraceae bacterium]|nr:DegV family protein [Lachnospiraceae bacterium]
MAKELGVYVLPMPFMIDGNDYYEDINLTQEQFYEMLLNDCVISTSQPSPDDVMKLWDKLLKEYDEIVHIPMSSGLSGSFQTARMLAEDYEDKVYVVNNQRISVTMKQSVLDALNLANEGKSAKEIHRILEDDKFNSSIYIMVDTLKYLSRGGRLTPAAAMIGQLLKIKPVLQIQGEKLDAFAKVRTIGQAKTTMLNQTIKDVVERYKCSDDGSGVKIFVVYSHSDENALPFLEEVKERFPKAEVFLDRLSLSVSCHIGPGALAIAITKNM